LLVFLPLLDGKITFLEACFLPAKNYKTTFFKFWIYLEWQSFQWHNCVFHHLKALRREGEIDILISSEKCKTKSSNKRQESVMTCLLMEFSPFTGLGTDPNGSNGYRHLHEMAFKSKLELKMSIFIRTVVICW